MAGRSGHVDAVNERRLKPLYDNLDNGNYKIALQAADKLLKKHKDLHCAKVLKALALLRIGRRKESFALTEEVVAVKPTDEPTLSALSICFREMQKPELIVEIYSSALKSHPQNEEFHTHLFMALVRIGNAKRQQQVAMALYKVFPKNPYYFWGVMSVVMQGITSPDQKLSSTMFFPLSEKMVEKMVKEKKLDAEAEVILYLMILNYLSKHEKALEILDSDLGKLMNSEFHGIPCRKAELYFKMEKWAEANSAYRKLLQNEPDNWSFYEQYYKSAFKLIDSAWTPPESEEEKSKLGQVDHTLDLVVSFVEERVEAEMAKTNTSGDAGGGRMLRGPFLARLELLRQLVERGHEEEAAARERIGTAPDLVRHYHSLFGAKFCCYSDLCRYTDLLAGEDGAIFTQSLVDARSPNAEEEGLSIATSIKGLQRHLNTIQLSRRLGIQANLSISEKLDVAMEMAATHRQSLRLAAGNITADHQYADDYLLLAVHILLDVWEESENDKHLWKAILLLEMGIKNSQHNSQMKLLLMRLYCLAGAFGPVPDLFTSLDIKHIQQDTLGYNAARFVKSLGHFSSANALYNSTLRFFTSNHKDTTEHIIAAYKFGSFHKIPEFLAFRKRVQHSLHFAQTTVEKMLLDIMLESESGNKSFEFVVQDMEIIPANDDTEWELLRDNRDLHCFVSWAPKERQLSEEDAAISSEQEKRWLRLRSLLLRALSAAAHLSPQHLPSLTHAENANAPTATVTESNNGEAMDRGEVLRRLIKELSSHAALLREDPNLNKRYPLQGPPQTATGEYLAGNHDSLLLAGLRLVLNVYDFSSLSSEDASYEKMQTTIYDLSQELLTTLRDSLRRSRRSIVIEKDEEKTLDRRMLSEVEQLVETSIFLILLSGVCYKTLRKLKQAAQKRSRKKKGGPQKPLPEIFEKFKSYLEELHQLMDGLHMAVMDTDIVFLFLKLEKMQLTDSDHEFYTEEEERGVWSKVEESYQESSKEMSEALKGKIEYLASLKL
ncbi:N-alpha-acetyltransferase 25, NatB auxiliary subunit-like [Diadema setosum]|uniref:N-alpha-acetyltransferase 25, NatB auxiliary subunit-like n=1 Tax=Diadema setosum TaxID=31175 RepID=UPI003B3AA3C0